MKVVGIDHIHIAVRDLPRAVELWERLLGTRFEHYGTNDEIGITAVKDPLGIALTAATKPESFLAQFLKRRGEGVQSLAIEVGDLDAAMAQWQGMGVRLLGQTRMNGERAAQFHPGDTSGTLIELIEKGTLELEEAHYP